MKLPKNLASNAPFLEGFEKIYQTERKLLWEKGSLSVLNVDMSEKMEQALSITRRAGQLRGGFEMASSLLLREYTGLMAVGRSSERVCRLLVMANDGSERFYRNCESLLRKYDSMMMGIVLKDVEGMRFGKRFFGSESQVKVALVTQSVFVEKILLSLVS